MSKESSHSRTPPLDAHATPSLIPPRPVPPQVKDPRITLAAALDAAGSHLSSRPEWVQAVFEEVSGAMTKTSLLLTALAHKD